MSIVDSGTIVSISLHNHVTIMSISLPNSGIKVCIYLLMEVPLYLPTQQWYHSVYLLIDGSTIVSPYLMVVPLCVSP